MARERNPIAWLQGLQLKRTGTLTRVPRIKRHKRWFRKAYRDPAKRRKLNRARRSEAAGHKFASHRGRKDG